MPDIDSETEALPVPPVRKARRSAAQMKVDREEVAATKELKALAHKQAIKKVAKVENDLAAADVANRQTAARPAMKGVTKVPRLKSKMAVNSGDDSDMNSESILLYCLTISNYNSVEGNTSQISTKPAPKTRAALPRQGRTDVNVERELLREENTQKRKASISSDM